MAKIFYDHLIKIEEVLVELNQHELEKEERAELIDLIDETLHHHTLDVILSHLPTEHHEKFLAHFHRAPHDPHLLVFLKETVTVDIEELITVEGNKVKKEILEDIKKSRHK